MAAVFSSFFFFFTSEFSANSMRSWYLTQMTDHEERVFSFEFPAKFLSIDVQDVHKLFIENLSAIFVKFLFYRWRARWNGFFRGFRSRFFESFLFLIDKSLGSKWTDLFKDGGWIENCTWLLITKLPGKTKSRSPFITKFATLFYVKNQAFSCRVNKVPRSKI